MSLVPPYKDPDVEPEPPFEAAVWLTLPSHIETEEQAQKFIAAQLEGTRLQWKYMKNYYGEEFTPRQMDHPSLE